MRLAARLFLIFLFSTFCFVSAVPSAHAQVNPYATANTDTNVPANMHTYVQSLTLEMLSSFICLLDGQDVLSPGHPCLGVDPTTQKLGYVANNHGLLGTVTDMTVAMYTPPVQIGQYMRYVSQNFGLVKKTYADTTCDTRSIGVGFCSISPLIGIWSAFRNIVYLFFVVIFMLVGFGIMVRYKIDPRTVMSIENQIPKLIIALVMVTFSFAIAGILIDGMWVSSFAVVNILTGVDTQNPLNQQDANNSFFQNPLGFANNVLPGGVVGATMGSAGSAGDLIRGILTPENSNKLGLTPRTPSDCENSTPFFGFFGTAFCNLGNTVGDIVAGALGYLISWVVSILAILVFLIAIIWSMFRLWFALLGAYVGILIDVILGPFKIALGVLPGSKTNYMSWIKDMLANLMAFPTAIAMFLLARLLMDAFNTNTSLFVPPLIGNPLGTAGNGNPLGFLIGTGMVLLTPNVVNMTKGLFKVESGKNGQIIMGALGYGFGSINRVVGGAITTAMTPKGRAKKMMGDAENPYYEGSTVTRFLKNIGALR